MRDLVLMFVIAGICVAGVMTPVVGLLGYVWFALMRPDVLAWSTRPYSLVLAVLTLGLSWRHLANIGNLLSNPISRMLLIQQVPIALSVLFAVQISLSTAMYERYMRMIVMVLLIPLMIDTEKWLRILYFVMVFSMGAMAAKMALFGILHGGNVVLVKGFVGMYGDSNGLALAMAILIPLAMYARSLTEHYLLKLACLGVAGCAVLTVVLTGSRGNALAVAVVMLLVLWRSKYKLLGLFLIALLIVPVLYITGDRLSQRMQSIADYEEDASASGRLDFWKAALKMSADYPVFGVGYGEKNYIALASRYLGRENKWVVHNTYLQMLVDTGIIGFLAYVITLWGTIIWLGVSARRMKRLKPEWLAYPLGLQSALIAFAVGSTFYSRADFEFAYMVMMSAAAWYCVERNALREMAEAAQAVPVIAGAAIKPLWAPAHAHRLQP